MATVSHPLPAVALTSGKPHFFGYYDKFAVDATGRYHLALEVEFMDRMPEPDDRAVVGMVDLEDGNRFIPFDETTAWCWQQASMLQWLGSAPDREVVYNIRNGGAYRCRVRDVVSGETRELPRPIYCLSADGRLAGTLNFSRVHACRPGYGYNGIPDPNESVRAPADDGVWVMDMASGEARLVADLASLSKRDPHPVFPDAKHWVNHLLFNPSGTWISFLHRWTTGTHWGTRFLVARSDGSEVRTVADENYFSHYFWIGDGEILGHATHGGEKHFFIFDIETGAATPVGPDDMPVDGHCSVPPTGTRWVVNDTYPQGYPPMRTLYLYDRETETRFDLGRYMSPNPKDGAIRCDLHPRWSRDGRSISFDSLHEGCRQVYRVDVSELVDG